MIQILIFSKGRRTIPSFHFLESCLKSFKKSGVKKILWEIPTYPYDDETTSFSRKIKKMIDKVFRGNLKKYVSRIVTFSNEKNIFGIETINTGNGIDIDEIRKRKVSDHGDEINLVAAAVVRDWHGYDRLIEGLSNYKGDRKISFHLAGDGPSLLIYKELVKKYNLEDKVHFYGLVNKDKLDEIYDIADIAVESLGWHRSKVKFGTSIKTREYLAKGLPIIASSVMDMFPDGFEYAYYAKIDGILTLNELKSLEKGIILDGVKTKKAYLKVDKIDKKNNKSYVYITITEGRNHQVKNMFSFFNHKVLKLKRVSYSFLNLDGLKKGEYRNLSIKEVKQLYNIINN